MRTRVAAVYDPYPSPDLRYPRRYRPWRFRLGEPDTIVLDSYPNHSLVFGRIDHGSASIAVVQRITHRLEHDLYDLLDHQPAGGKCGFNPESSSGVGGDTAAQRLIKVGQRSNIGSHLIELSRYARLQLREMGYRLGSAVLIYQLAAAFKPECDACQRLHVAVVKRTRDPMA